MPAATARTVTMLFTDLVASTELAGSLPASSADEVRRAHFAALEQAVASTDGSVVKSLGDGLMVSYESVAQALAGAVAMQRAVARHNRRPKQPTLAMRVGLSVGEATSEDGDWFGPPVIEAARLCAEAEGGQILTTDVVRALVGNRSEFGIKTLGVHDLKGLPDPVPVCEVAWQEHAGASVGLPVGLTLDLGRSGFVGRDDELARLTQGWERARSGERQLILVAGEPGIGKTRLVAELALRAHGAGATVLFGRCYEETLTPYQPFVEAFAGAGLELGELVPVTLAGSSLGPVLSQGGPESDRYLLFEAVTKVLADLADDAAVVVVLDDLHWADKATLLMLEYLARTARPMAVLVVGTYRETDLARDHPLSETLADLRRERLYERIMLRGLDREELGAFVADRAGQEAPPVFVDALYAETEGNPFFADEVLLHLVESGAIYERDGQWRSDVTSVDQLGIPEGVRDAIGRRLSRLSETTNRVLAVASVLGREFLLSVVEAVSDVGTEDLLDAVDQASAARLITEVPGDPDRYGFTHALIRQTLYDELGAARRLRLHQRAGEALEARYGADVGPHLGELASHFSQLAYGGDVDKAVDYCSRAALRASGLMAYEEAAEHYRRALQVLEIAESGGDARECDLRIALTTALNDTVDFVQGSQEGQRAVELARRLGDDRRFAAAAAATSLISGELIEWQVRALDEALALPDIDPVIRARLLSGRAYRMTLIQVSEHEREIAGREAVSAARALGDPVELLAALYVEHTYIRNSPDLERAADLADELSALAATTAYPRAQGWALAAHVHTALSRGDVSECQRAIDTARAASDASTNSFAMGVSILVEATLALLQGRFSEGEEAARRGLAIGRPSLGAVALTFYGLQLYALRRDQGRLAEMEIPLRALLDRFWDAPASAPALHAGLAYLYLETDRLDRASVELERIFDDGRYRRVDAGVITVAYLSEVAAALDHQSLATELYERLLAYDGQSVVVLGLSYCNGAVARYLGLLAACLGRTDDAERHFNDALTMNERMGARPWVARTKLDFAHLLAIRGTPADIARARQLAADSLTISEAIDMPRVHDRARSLADQLLS